MLDPLQFRMDAHKHRFSDVRADIRDPLHVCHQVLKVGVRVNIALPFSHSIQMMLLELAQDLAGDFLQRLDPEGCIYVALFKRQIHRIQDLSEKILHNTELFISFLGKARLCAVHMMHVVRNVYGMVSETLELRNDFIVLVKDIDVFCLPQMRKELHNIAADPVCEMVYDRLIFHDLVV